MPTIKQKKAARYLVKDGDDIKGALNKAGDAPTIANQNTYKVTESKGFIEALKQAGVTEKKLSEVLNEGLSANKVISAKIVGKNANESTDDFIEVPDHAVRHKFLETGLKVHNLINTFETKNITQINVMTDSQEAGELRDRITNFIEGDTLAE